MDEFLIRIAVFVVVALLIGMSWRAEGTVFRSPRRQAQAEPVRRKKQAITTFRVARSKRSSRRG